MNQNIDLIKDEFLLCKNCHKKIMPIRENDVMIGVVYCTKCKNYFEIVIAQNEVFKCDLKIK